MYLTDFGLTVVGALFFLGIPLVLLYCAKTACEEITNTPLKAKVVRVRGFYGFCIGYSCSYCKCGRAGNTGYSVQINYKQYKNCPRCGALLDWDNIVEEEENT